MKSWKAEISCFLSVSKDDVQECRNGEQDRDLSIFRSRKNSSQQGCKQVIEKSSKDAACAIPECLTRQFFDRTQGGCFPNKSTCWFTKKRMTRNTSPTETLQGSPLDKDHKGAGVRRLKFLWELCVLVGDKLAPSATIFAFTVSLMSNQCIWKRSFSLLSASFSFPFWPGPRPMKRA